MNNGFAKFIDLLHRSFIKRGSIDPFHAALNEFIAMARNAPSPAILEIGSRNVTGVTRRNMFPECKDYIGFDILEGEGVDVVGDLHGLSSYFSEDRFDFVFSISVFEHVLFPWKAALEINKVMKQGGYVLVTTHPVWPPHELPWDFWRFPKNGFHALFNKYTGFEIINLTEGLPCKMYSLAADPPTRTNSLYTLNQGVAVIARKTGEYRKDLIRWDIDIGDVIDTMYPNK